MAGKSPIALAMGYFGKLPGQGIKDFKDEFDRLSDESKQQLADGLSGDNPTLTY